MSPKTGVTDRGVTIFLPVMISILMHTIEMAWFFFGFIPFNLLTMILRFSNWFDLNEKRATFIGFNPTLVNLFDLNLRKQNKTKQITTSAAAPTTATTT